MLETLSSDAAKMLILLFWITIGFAIVWGILWTHAIKNSKAT
jgi:hypothetical protein